MAVLLQNYYAVKMIFFLLQRGWEWCLWRGYATFLLFHPRWHLITYYEIKPTNINELQYIFNPFKGLLHLHIDGIVFFYEMFVLYNFSDRGYKSEICHNKTYTNKRGEMYSPILEFIIKKGKPLLVELALSSAFSSYTKLTNF